MNPHELVESGELVWFQAKGYGYIHPLSKENYGRAYFEEYESRACNDVSDDLMRSRLLMVNRHIGDDDLVDVGAGSCAFIEMRNSHGPTVRRSPSVRCSCSIFRPLSLAGWFVSKSTAFTCLPLLTIAT